VSELLRGSGSRVDSGQIPLRGSDELLTIYRVAGSAQ
jgi:hypothetical protein